MASGQPVGSRGWKEWISCSLRVESLAASSVEPIRARSPGRVAARGRKPPWGPRENAADGPTLELLEVPGRRTGVAQA